MQRWEPGYSPRNGRAQQVGDDVVEACHKRAKQLLPRDPIVAQPGNGCLERSMQDRGAAPIQRMSQGEIGLNPTKPVLVQRKLPERRRGGPQRVHGGANVVRETGQSQLCRTGAASDRFLGLENDHT